MKKYLNINTKLKLKEIQKKELTLYTFFYLFQMTCFTVFRGSSFQEQMETPEDWEMVNNILISYLFSLFLFFFVLYNALMENIYGYYLAAALMLHNFILSFFMIVLPYIRIDLYFCIVGIPITVSYLIELFVALFFIRKKRFESNRAIFRRVGADIYTNRIFSDRKQLEAFSHLNLFIPIVVTRKHYSPISAYRVGFDYFTLIILILSFIQHLLIYTNFNEENMIQRIITIIITVIKTGFSLALLFLTGFESNVISNCDLTPEIKVGKIILYADISLISLIVLYYLWIDMTNFKQGLKRSMLVGKEKYPLR